MSLMLAAVLVCNLNALNHTERAQLNTYLDQLSTSAANRQELSNGYSWTIDQKKMSIAEVGEWIALESRCCPFLSFTVELPASGSMKLTLTGGADVKEFILAEMHKLPKG